MMRRRKSNYQLNIARIKSASAYQALRPQFQLATQTHNNSISNSRIPLVYKEKPSYTALCS